MKPITFNRLKEDNCLFLIISFLSALCILFIFTKSSPLYPINPLVDTNAELSMGHVLLKGKIPYRDAYDHRGPILHFIFAVACIFSHKSYMGVYMLEVISLTAFLYYNAKIAKIYLKSPKLTIQIIPLLAVLIASSDKFMDGGSPEQLMLPFFSIPMFFIIRALKNDTYLKKHEALLSGIFAAIVFWIKYSDLGVYCGFIIFVVIWYTIFKKDVKALAEVIFYFVAGYAVVTLPLILYFALNRSLKFLFEVYFYDNIFKYANKAFKSAVIGNLYYKTSLTETLFFVVNLISISYVIFFNEKKEKLLIVASFTFAFWGTYCLSNYLPYYAIQLFTFSVFGLVGVISIFSDNKKATAIIKRVLAFTALLLLLFSIMAHFLIKPVSGGYDVSTKIAFLCLNLAFILIICILYATLIECMKKNKWLYLLTCMTALFLSTAMGFVSGYDHSVLKYKSEDMYICKITEYIQRKENPKILYYNLMDIGIYHLLDQAPEVRYFYKPNVNDENILSEMKKYIETKEADFIISSEALENIDIDIDGYKLVDSVKCEVEITEFYNHLYLYEKTH